MRYVRGAYIKARDLKIANFTAYSGADMGKKVDAWMKVNPDKRVADVQIDVIKEGCYGFVLYTEATTEFVVAASPLIPAGNLGVFNITQYSANGFAGAIQSWLAANPDKLIADVKITIISENCYAFMTFVDKA